MDILIDEIEGYTFISKRKMYTLMQSIRQHGTSPIKIQLADEGDRLYEVVDGHARLQACIELGMTKVPVEFVMKHYVVGLMFDPQQRFLLILKNRPLWQAGKYNGVGGYVEPGESRRAAMVREFEEETDIKTHEADWEEFLVLQDARSAWKIYFFRAQGNIERYIQRTDEKPAIFSLQDLYKEPVISNLRWIVPLALDDQMEIPIHLFVNERHP